MEVLTMSPRLNAAKAAPAAYHAMRGLEQYVKQSGLEPSLIELVKLRASYMNGCAYCIDMHTKDALAAGETIQRIVSIPVWRETPFFTDRERAALAWTEGVTDLHPGHVPDELYRETNRFFTDEEMVKLTMAVVTINGWNRLAIAFRTEPGTYQRPAAAPGQSAA
jgi:AhpD family alkylhydroperoxidase